MTKVVLGTGRTGTTPNANGKFEATIPLSAPVTASQTLVATATKAGRSNGAYQTVVAAAAQPEFVAPANGITAKLVGGEIILKRYGFTPSDIIKTMTDAVPGMVLAFDQDPETLADWVLVQDAEVTDQGTPINLTTMGELNNQSLTAFQPGWVVRMAFKLNGSGISETWTNGSPNPVTISATESVIYSI